jgi:hypothetical protein
VGPEFELKSFKLAKQELYNLRNPSSPFCCGYFGDGEGSLELSAMLALNLDCPDLSPQVARVRGESHWHLVPLPLLLFAVLGVFYH